MLSVTQHADIIVLDAALLLCSLYNDCSDLCGKCIQPTPIGLFCSNTYSNIMSTPKKIDVSIILQVISKHRSEQCCLSLISCLLASCKVEQMTVGDDDSESSSVEVLKALTTHLSSPINFNGMMIDEMTRTKSAPTKSAHSVQTIQTITASDSELNDPAIKFFDNMAMQGGISTPTIATNFNNSELDGVELLEQLIFEEETNIANILLKCVKLCPSAFG